MQSRLVFMGMALILGAILPLQATVNGRLSRAVSSPVVAAFISFAVGTVALLIYLVVSRQLQIPRQAVQSPWWVWSGGLLGTFFVAGIVMLLPRLGVALAFSLVLSGQMLAAMIFDHIGFLGVSIREISLGRIVGALLLIAGIILIRKF